MNNMLSPLKLPALKKELKVPSNDKSVVPPSGKNKNMSDKTTAVSSTGKKSHEPLVDTESVRPSTHKIAIISPTVKKHIELKETCANKKPTKNAEDSSFPCTTCLKSFKHKRTLLSHIGNECGKVLRCTSCKREFTYFKGLKRHMKSPCRKVWKCLTCKDVFKQKKNFIKHKKYECGKILQCPVCNKVFMRKSSLDRHLPLCSRSK